jgi:hypothetical protein
MICLGMRHKADASAPASKHRRARFTTRRESAPDSGHHSVRQHRGVVFLVIGGSSGAGTRRARCQTPASVAATVVPEVTGQPRSAGRSARESSVPESRSVQVLRPCRSVDAAAPTGCASDAGDRGAPAACRAGWPTDALEVDGDPGTGHGAVGRVRRLPKCPGTHCRRRIARGPVAGGDDRRRVSDTPLT